MTTTIKDVRRCLVNDRQMREYTGEYYTPEWTCVKLSKPRGKRGSLTIDRENEHDLRDMLLTYKTVEEFSSFQVYVKGRVTPFKAKIEWLGNGAALLLEDGFIVYEATSAPEAYLEELNADDAESQGQKEYPAIHREYSNTETPAKGETNNHGYFHNNQEAVMAPKATMTQQPKHNRNNATHQSAKPKVVQQKPQVNRSNDFKKAPAFGPRSSVASVSSYKGLVIDICLFNQVPLHVKERVAKATDILARALGPKYSDHKAILHNSGELVIRVLVNRELAYETKFTVPDGIGMQEVETNGKVSCGPYEKKSYWKYVSAKGMELLKGLMDHVDFAEKMISANINFQLDNLDKSAEILSEATPSGVERKLLCAVFGRGESSLHDRYTQMYRKLTSNVDELDAMTEFDASSLLHLADSATEPVADAFVQAVVQKAAEAPTTKKVSEQEKVKN